MSDDIQALIEASSLGTPEAKALRESVDPALVERVMEQVRERGGLGCAGSGRSAPGGSIPPCPACGFMGCHAACCPRIAWRTR